MSWHFSQALVAESLAATCSDGAVSAPLSMTTMHAAFSWHDRTTGASRRFRYGMMSEPLMDAHGEVVLTWCLEASRARTSAPLARVQESMESDPDYGPRWRALSVRFNPDTCGWRTAHCLLEEDLDWSLLTLPRWGSLQDGELLERITLERRTKETEFGCWPTPKASAAGPDFAAVKRKKSISLQTAVAMFPTPCASEGRQGYQNRNNGKKGSQKSLTTIVQAGPSDLVGGSLNPTWVEWLMGWPLGWTDCGASATVRFREWCSAHGMT